MASHWEAAPRHMMRLDIRSLLQDAAIEGWVSLWLESSAEATFFSTIFYFEKILNYRKAAWLV